MEVNDENTIDPNNIDTIDEVDTIDIIDNPNANANANANANNIEISIGGSMRVSRGKFEKACMHCNKIMKSIKSYNRHVDLQLCYSKNEITYCKVCNITLNTHNDYIKHVLSMAHINSIGCNKLDILNNNQPSTILQADPYLTNNEAANIGTSNLGHKFTFVFHNTQIQTISLQPTTGSNPTSGSNPITSSNPIIGSNIASSNTNNVVHEAQPDVCILEPSPKQQKILSILGKASSKDEANKLLIKLLDTKLNIEDYYGLQKFINNTNIISTDLKTLYSNVIDKFVALMVKRRNNGETIYKDKDISKIVISLTI